MSRIGKKPIALPANVKYTVDGNTVLVEGPKGKVTALIPKGISLVKKDNDLLVERENDSQAGFHGLARALVFNAVTGVTTGHTKELDIVGIGYREVFLKVWAPVFLCAVPFAMASYAVDALYPARHMATFILQTIALLPIFALSVAWIFWEKVQRKVLPRIKSYFHAEAN